MNHFGETVEIDGNLVNPVGYQTVLYVTLALYIVALILSFLFVRPTDKALEAKAAKKAAKNK